MLDDCYPRRLLKLKVSFSLYFSIRRSFSCALFVLTISSIFKNTFACKRVRVYDVYVWM